jgi:cell division topological specificity factor
MSFLDYLFGQKKSTANVAKERLQLIIAHERGGASKADFLPALQRELIEVISKYTKVNMDDIKVSLEKKNQYEVLEVNIVLPEIDTPPRP